VRGIHGIYNPFPSQEYIEGNDVSCVGAENEEELDRIEDEPDRIENPGGIHIDLSWGPNNSVKRLEIPNKIYYFLPLVALMEQMNAFGFQ